MAHFELILDAAELLINPLVLTLNQILDKGVSPPRALVSFIGSTKLETEMILEITEASQFLVFCPNFMQ